MLIYYFSAKNTTPKYRYVILCYKSILNNVIYFLIDVKDWSHMKILQKRLESQQMAYPIEQFAPLHTILYLDIETTGFQAKSSYVYLIGCAFFSEEHWNSIQWFAETPDEESMILKAFLLFSQNYHCLIHYNGNNFDLPFLKTRFEVNGLDGSFDHFLGIDIYRRISPYRFFLKLSNCKQKSIEQFLQITREDPYSGGDLINYYWSYTKIPTPDTEHILTQHNFEDIIGMLKITPILAYSDLFNKPLKATKAHANYYKDSKGLERQEILIKIDLPSELKSVVSYEANGCYFSGQGKEGTLKIPLYQEELKYFYANYKDYYYLPKEDVAIHKSVSSFVDKTHRTPASAATCYTRKFSTYLPEWDYLFEPFFRRDFKAKELFFELTDELKTNREAFSVYATHIMAMLATSHTPSK